MNTKERLRKIRFFHKARINKDLWSHKIDKKEKPKIRGWATLEKKMASVFKDKFKQFKKEFDYRLIDLVFGRFAIDPKGEKQGADIVIGATNFILNQKFGIGYSQNDINKIQSLLKEFYLFGMKQGREKIADAVVRLKLEKGNQEKRRERILIGLGLGGLLITESLSQETIQYITDLGTDLVSQISQTQKNRIAELISNDIRDGAGIDEIQNDLKDEFREWESSRAEMISTTELAGTIGLGLAYIYSQHGIKEREWICTGPSPCPECAPNCGATTTTEDGSDFPNPGLPLFHPYCYCVLDPIVDENTLDDLMSQYSEF